MQTINFHTKSTVVPLNVEVKKNPKDIKKGLMWRRKPLGENTGALFDMGTDSDHKFWMKNTFIPLDMVFVDKNFKVVGIVPKAKPLSTEPRHVGKKSRYVIEVDAGWASKNGVTVGTKVEAPMHKTAKLEHKPEPTRDSPEGKELLRIRGILRKAQTELGEGTSVFLVAGSNKYPGIGGEVTKGSARDPYIASHAKLHERWSAQQGYSKWGKKLLPQTGPNKSGPSNIARHTRKLKSGKRVEVKPHTRKRSGSLEDRYPEIKFQRQTARIKKALTQKAKRGYSTRNEPLHIKYGPKVHFGVGRHGAHFGIYGKGPTTHFYENKVHIGGKRNGTTYKLSPEQKSKIQSLMREREALKKKRPLVKEAGPVTELLRLLGNKGAVGTIEKSKNRAAGFLAKDVPGTRKVRFIPKEKAQKLSRAAVDHPIATTTTLLAPGGSIIGPMLVGVNKALTKAIKSRQK